MQHLPGSGRASVLTANAGTRARVRPMGKGRVKLAIQGAAGLREALKFQANDQLRSLAKETGQWVG